MILLLLVLRDTDGVDTVSEPAPTAALPSSAPMISVPRDPACAASVTPPKAAAIPPLERNNAAPPELPIVIVPVEFRKDPAPSTLITPTEPELLPAMVLTLFTVPPVKICRRPEPS